MNREWVKNIIETLSVPTLDELNIPELLKLKEKFIPPSLYKIRNCSEYALENLANQTLYLSNANSFNDPYDTAFWGNYDSLLTDDLCKNIDPNEKNTILKSPNPLKAAYEKIIKVSAAEPESGYENFINKAIAINREYQTEQLLLLVNHLKECYKICSLSARIDSVVMWSHYGQNHTGFAMEYDFSSLQSEHIIKLMLWPVAYTSELFDITPILTAQRNKSVNFNCLFGISAALQKAQEWQYEHEWRLVHPDGNENSGINLSAPLKAVHLGSKISESDEINIREICSRTNTPVFKMKLSTHQYKMHSVL